MAVRCGTRAPGLPAYAPPVAGAMRPLLVATLCSVGTAEAPAAREATAGGHLEAARANPELPFVVYNWSEISLMRVSEPAPPPWGASYCCGSNYSVALDTDGQLLALALDNVLCPAAAAAVKHEGLHSGLRWETAEEVLARARDRTVSQFPGATAHDDQTTALKMRRCIAPLLSELLTARNHRPFHAVLQEAEHTRGSKADNGLVMRSMQPLTSVFAALTLEPSQLSHVQSNPHVDTDDVDGLAMIYTITEDPRFEASGTALVRHPTTGATFLRSDPERQIVIDANDRLQEEAVARGQPVHNGYFNGSRNRFGNAILVSRNRHNRALFYPANRLHTGVLEHASLVSPTPEQGRLTLNVIYVMTQPTEGRCAGVSTDDPQQREKMLEELQGATSVCMHCLQHKGCGWSASLSKCVASLGYDGQRYANRGELVLPRSSPGDVRPGARKGKGSHRGGQTNESDIEAICRDSIARHSCERHSSCMNCTDHGCGWCLGWERCMPDRIGFCPSETYHVGSAGSGSCLAPEPGGRLALQEPCLQHRSCRACRRAGCGWCLVPTSDGQGRCVADSPDLCRSREAHVGTAGGSCPASDRRGAQQAGEL